MFENTKFKNGVDYYHRLNFVFNLMIAFPLVPFILLYLGKLSGDEASFGFSSNVALIIDLLLVVSIILLTAWALRQYEKGRSDAIGLAGLRAKMISLHNLLVNMYGRLVIGCFLASVGLFFTGSNIHVILFVIILVVFSLKRPSVKMIVQELQLKGEDSVVLRERTPID